MTLREAQIVMETWDQWISTVAGYIPRPVMRRARSAMADVVTVAVLEDEEPPQIRRTRSTRPIP